MTQQSRFLNDPLARRPIPQSMQLPVGPQQASTVTTSRSSSQSSSTQILNSAVSNTPGAQSNIFGKTSGWYHGAKFDVADMWKAALNRDHDTLKRCIKAGLNINHARWVKDDSVLGTGARSVADAIACKNDMASMRLLVEHGVDLSGSTIATFVSKTLVQRDFLLTGAHRKVAEKAPWTTPLHLACRYSYIGLVRIILDDGHADPNTRDSQNQTGLHTTVIGKGVADVARLLLDRGAMVDVRDHLDATPLTIAAFYGKLELVELLIEYGANIDATDSRGETALYNASLRSHSDVVVALAARGADIDLKNIDGMSAFFKAASMLNTNIMNILIECGGDTDTRDSNGCTALARATMANNIPLMMHLLQLGVDIDGTDSDGWTPLLTAMVHNGENLIRPLLAYGSNVEKTDNYNNTALHQAAILGATLVTRHILALHSHNRIDYSEMNVFGETPLALACKHNSSPIVKVMLGYGVNPHHVDPNGYRALDRAMYWGSFACVRHLLEAGAGIDSRALLALQQGKHDNPDGAGNHDIILAQLGSKYPGLCLPIATMPSPLRDLFAQTMSRNHIRTRMCEKQGKPALDLISSKDEKSNEEIISPDPFESCIPKPPPSQIINNNTTNIKANGTSVMEIGAVGTSIALGITNTVLGL